VAVLVLKCQTSVIFQMKIINGAQAAGHPAASGLAEPPGVTRQ
jgi:hypothetical protein